MKYSCLEFESHPILPTSFHSSSNATEIFCVSELLGREGRELAGRLGVDFGCHGGEFADAAYSSSLIS